LDEILEGNVAEVWALREVRALSDTWQLRWYVLIHGCGVGLRGTIGNECKFRE